MYSVSGMISVHCTSCMLTLNFFYFPNSKQIKGGLSHQADLLSQASKEVERFCEDHSWVAEIHEFVTSWGDGHTDVWRGKPATKIEVSFKN